MINLANVSSSSADLGTLLTPTGTGRSAGQERKVMLLELERANTG